ncbi:substrate-binding domain-containing protein [Nocardioides immobilis]|uniref:substrate-binding domain-containing protein n=1 Tax=Nocardioides immobilis TaxID=2049295 RepID=UPI0015FD9563|nr:substrate-binding domain-containing protein [Nocardioides immobilis]
MFPFLLAAVVALAPGCAITNGDGNSSGGSFTVAYVPGVTKNPYFSTIKRAMDSVAEANDITVDYQGTPNFDPTEQTNVLNAVLAQKPDLLILAPTDPVALRAPVERFLAADIPVILIDGNLENEDGIISTIQSDQEAGGRLAGERMAELTDGKGTVAVINIVSGVPSLDARVEGFTNALQDAAPDIELAPVQNAGGNPSQSQDTTRSLMVAYPDLAGVFGVTEVNAEGAAAAFKAAGKDIPIAAYDATPLEVSYLEEGQIDFLVAQNAKRIGELAMQFAVDYLNGDEDSVERHVVLDTVGVDLENIEQPEIAEVLYGPAIN